MDGAHAGEPSFAKATDGFRVLQHPLLISLYTIMYNTRMISLSGVIFLIFYIIYFLNKKFINLITSENNLDCIYFDLRRGKPITPGGAETFPASTMPTGNFGFNIRGEERIVKIVDQIREHRQKQLNCGDGSSGLPLDQFRMLTDAVYTEETSRTNYPFNRTLEGEHTSYVVRLPTWKAKDQTTKQEIDITFVEVIERLINEREEEAKNIGTTYKPVKILDVGYGNGQAMLDAAKKWGNKVQLIGYGSSRLTDYTGRTNTLSGSISVPTRQFLAQAGVELIEGNIIDIDEKIPKGKKPDVILCCQVLQYIPYPQWEVLRKIYSCLDKEGYAFISLADPNQSFWLNPDTHPIITQEYQRLRDLLSISDHDNFQVNPEKGYLAFQATEKGFPNNIKARWPEILDQEKYVEMIRKFGLFPFVNQ